MHVIRCEHQSDSERTIGFAPIVTSFPRPGLLQQGPLQPEPREQLHHYCGRCCGRCRNHNRNHRRSRRCSHYRNRCCSRHDDGGGDRGRNRCRNRCHNHCRNHCRNHCCNRCRSRWIPLRSSSASLHNTTTVRRSDDGVGRQNFRSCCDFAIRRGYHSCGDPMPWPAIPGRRGRWRRSPVLTSHEQYCASSITPPTT